MSLSVSKSLLFYQENASINVALNSHWCPQEDLGKKILFKDKPVNVSSTICLYYSWEICMKTGLLLL